MSIFEVGWYKFGNLEHGKVLQIVKRTKSYIWAIKYNFWDEDQLINKKHIKLMGECGEAAVLDNGKYISKTFANKLVKLTQDELQEFLLAKIRSQT